MSRSSDRDLSQDEAGPEHRITAVSLNMTYDHVPTELPQGLQLRGHGLGPFPFS